MKTLVLVSLFNKVAGHEGLQLYLKVAATQMFPCENCEIFKKPILKNI